MLRVLLALLPFLALSFWHPSESDGDEDQDDAADDDDESTDDDARIEAEVQRKLNSILGNERKKLSDSIREEVRKELKDEAERKTAEENEEFKELWEKAEAERKAAEAKAERAEQEYQKQLETRVVKAEVKAEAADRGFIDPEIAYRLIDLDEVAYDDDGEPKNLTTLINRLAKDRPYLIADEKTRPVEHSRANGRKQSVDEIERQYLEQVGVKP